VIPTAWRTPDITSSPYLRVFLEEWQWVPEPKHIDIGNDDMHSKLKKNFAEADLLPAHLGKYFRAPAKVPESQSTLHTEGVNFLLH